MVGVEYSPKMSAPQLIHFRIECVLKIWRKIATVFVEQVFVKQVFVEQAFVEQVFVEQPCYTGSVNLLDGTIKGQKLLEVAGQGWKWLKMTENGKLIKMPANDF